MFYGVASTVLGDGAVQRSGPETGLHERTGLAAIQAYYDHAMQRLIDSGQVTFLGGWEFASDGAAHSVVSRLTGERAQVHVRRRVVDAAYLAPTIPASS